MLLDMTLKGEKKFNLATGLHDLLLWGKGAGTGLCAPGHKGPGRGEATLLLPISR